MYKPLNNNAVKIAEGQNTLIFYQEESDYGKPVIVKVLKEEYNFYPHTIQIINEDEHLRNLSINGIRSSMDRVLMDSKPAIILEYFQGVTLKELILAEEISLIDRLKIAIDISAALGKVHDLGIIHKDFSSHNILVNEHLEPNIIDFGLSTKLSTKPDLKTASEYMEGTLPYISPEQTGRVNHVVDQRSDLYSLGVVLYELFSGELPFTTQDPMELVHSHLAILPTPLNVIDHEIPPVISDIVAKLLSKNLESRYQTSYGVLSDLQQCHSQLKLKIAIEDFEIAQKDQSGKFLIPSKLYGRDKEVKLLLSAFERSGKKNEITLIEGYSGTGKTSLIYEIHKPLSQKKGYFAHGKHDQFQKDIPYHAMVQALRVFVNLLLSEKEERLKNWQKVIKDAVGTDGKLLTDLIPNLELIIGKQAPLAELGINEAQHRFDYTFLKFLKAIATEDHPFILFIDDLQWADGASLHLLKKIICDEDLEGFYFIGAYRGNEVDDAHPTILIFNEIRNRDIKINEIKLGDLQLQDVQTMISETLLLEEKRCRSLANIIYEKTAGNPFFVHQFLLSMHENGLITFKKDVEPACWHYDIEEIRNMNYTDNVAEFMIEKIGNLSPGPIEILKLGACIGDSFDTETLTCIGEKEEREVGEHLYEIVEDQYVTMQGYNPDFIHLQSKFGGNGDKGISVQYKFTHDRVRQAAYAMVPEELKSSLHLKIGRLMLQNTDPEKKKEKIFDIVYQLNNGINDIVSDAEKHNLSALNFQAALKAKSSSAYEKALSHCEIALGLFDKNRVLENKGFLMELLNCAMECSYLIGHYERMEQLGEKIVSNSENILDEVDAGRIIILSYIARNRYKDATAYGLRILRKLNIWFPETPNKLQIIASFLKTKLALRNKKASYFRNLPLISDQHASAGIKIIISFASAAYHNTPELFPLVVLKMIRMSLKYGTSPALISTYGGYGILLCGITGEMDEGYAYGQESLKMLKTFPNARQASSRTLVIYTTFINHWKDHLKESFPLLMRSYFDAMETGDQEFAAGALFVHSYHSFVAGESLATVTDRIVTHHQKIVGLNQKSYEYYNTIGYQAMVNLLRNGSNPAILKGEIFDEDDFLANKSGRSMQEDKTALFHYHFYKMSLHYLSGAYEAALKNSNVIRELDVAMSTALIPYFTFLDSLVHLALLSGLSGAGKTKLPQRIKSNQKKMKKWAGHAPMNYQHKYDLIEAGIYSVTGKNPVRAEALFEKSTQSAAENGYNNDLALACELAAKHYRSTATAEKEIIYLKKAFTAYKQWGIAVKIESISTEHEVILATPSEDRVLKSHTFVSVNTGNSMLDLSTVMKASYAIASEIRMKNLVHQLLRIVTENAGARTGAFILNDNDILKITAVLEENGEIAEEAPEDICNSKYVAEAVIQYVYRTKEDVVLYNACGDDQFSNDPGIKNRQSKSVLCMPVMRKTKLIGIIYLENDLVTGAFTTQRFELLRMLSGQIAISLENSMLYDNLEQKVAERTREIDEQREELKNKNKELMSINQEKDDLINVVSHDLRSPLNQVKGLAQIVKMETQDESIREYGSKIIEAIDRLNGMITRILDISAIEAQKIEIQAEEFDVVDQLNFVVDGFLQNATRKEIDLKLISNVKIGPVKLDRNYFIQIMENLISNAVKFCYKNGEINVIVLYTDGRVKIEVKDTGPGISESDQKMLFSKFQKLTAKPTSGEKSTGLGLSIVKRYVDAMGGKIWCESELYNGASFFIEFR